MTCQNETCLYQQNASCLLSSVSIDSSGQCEQCMIVAIPAPLLARLKQSHRTVLAGRSSVVQKKKPPAP